MNRSITQEEINDSYNVFTFNKDEDLTIIWFDDQIDEEIKIMLEHSHDHIHLCYSSDELTSLIDNINNEKIILIVAGRYSRVTLSRLHENQKIDTVYIFCLNSSLYQDLIDERKYSKLIGIYTEYGSLFTILKQQIHSILKHLSSFSLFNYIDKPLRDLESESSNYLWYQLFRDTLMTMETENANCKQQFIDYCRSYYRLNKRLIEQIDLFEQTYQSSDAIRWYTKDSFLYRFVNRALRTEDIEALFRLRYFIKDLCQNLNILFDQNFEAYQESLEEILVYRGLTLPMTVIDQLKESVGKYVSTNGFLSTTFKRDVAEMFGANVIFQIKIETDLKNIIYAYIAKLSFNPSEDEVLFDLGAIFQITDVQLIADKYLVSLIGIDNNIEYLKNDYFQIEREYLCENSQNNILSNINAHSLFGKFLSMIGSTKKAIDYFEELYKNCLANNNSSQLNEYEIYIITGNLADAYADNNQYDLALAYAFRCYEIHQHFKYNYSVPIAASLLRISFIYLNKKDIDSAFKYVQDAFGNLSIDCSDQLLGVLCLCIGRCYFEQKNYSNALKNCQEAVGKLTKTKNSMTLSEAHYTLAEIYWQQTNNDMAVEHYEQSLILQKNLYSNSHPTRIRTTLRLADICCLTEKYNSSVSYYLEIFKNMQFDDDNNGDQINLLHRRIAYCYLKLNQCDLAIKHAHISLTISEKLLDIERVELSYLLMDDIFTHQKNYDLSIECCEQLAEKALEYNNYEIMKRARSRYISNMTHLINEDTLERNTIIITKFYEKYLYPEQFLIFDDVQQILIAIFLTCLKKKKFSLGIQQIKTMLNDIERRPNSRDKEIIIVTLSKQIAWFYEKEENYQLAISQYQIILIKIKTITNYLLIDAINSIALQCFQCIGQLYYQLNDYKLAIESQFEGLEFIKHLNNYQQYEQEIFDFNYTISNCYVELDQHESALNHYFKCVEIEINNATINVRDSSESIVMYECAGDSYYKNEQYDLAIDCYRKALNILKEFDDQQVLMDIAEFNYKIGHCYKMQENIDSFIQHFHLASQIHEDNQLSSDKEQMIDVNFQLGWFYQQKEEYDLAIQYFQKMLSVQKVMNTDNNFEIGDSYVRLGRCYEQKLMSDTSLTFYEQATEVYAQIDTPDTIEKRKLADVHQRIGKIYQNKHTWDRSIEHYELALKILPGSYKKSLFDLYSDLANCYQQISDNKAQIIYYYEKAIQIQQDIKPYGESKIIQFYYEIGLYYQATDEFYSAIQYFQNAQNLLDEQEEKDVLKSTDIYTQLGFCFCDVQDWNSSINHCLIALGLYQSIEIYLNPSIYRLYVTTAHCYGQQEMYYAAIPYFEQALKIQEDQGNYNPDEKFEIIHLNNQLGFCNLMSDRYDIAHSYYDKSIETAKDSSFYTKHFSMPDNYEMLGYIYIYYKQKILAYNCFKKALKLFEDSKSTDSAILKRIRDLLENLKNDDTIKPFCF